MTPSLSSRGAVVLVGTAAVTVMATGISYAVWSVTGSGTGSAVAATAQPLGVATTAQVTGLYPGGSASGTLVITNPNPFAVKVTSLTFGAARADDGHAACTTPDVTFSASTTPTVVVPARVGTTHGSTTTGFTAAMGPASSDGCQGATLTATVTAAGTS